MRYRRRVTTIAVLSAVALTTSALAATPVDVQWSTPQAISTPPTPGAGPNNGRAAIAEDGTDAVAVWAQDQGDSKFQVWTAKEPLINAGFGVCGGQDRGSGELVS